MIINIRSLYDKIYLLRTGIFINLNKIYGINLLNMFKKDLANVPKFFDTLEKDFNEKSSE